MTVRSFIFDATPESSLRLGNLSGQGYEVSGTKLCIDVTRCVEAEKPGEIEVVQVWLTPPQMAELVKQFFKEVVTSKKIYASLLQRLLRTRWNLMTAPTAKESWLGDGGKPSLPSYDKVKT